MTRNPQVVITRKDKKLNRTGHLLAFVLTGGASGVITAAKAATNASYNARTRELQRQAEIAGAQLSNADRLLLRRAARVQARAELGVPEGKLTRDQKKAVNKRMNELLVAALR